MTLCLCLNAVGYFANYSEYCQPCYSGGICDGDFKEPRAAAGFYVGYNDTSDLRDDGCLANHTLTRSRCLRPRPCDPPESCLGDDRCSFEYQSVPPLYRCATCVKGYYRLSGACIKCPNNPWILICAFIVIIIAVAAIGYLLNRKSVNIAFLSTGIDYFQVLAMFSRSNIKWPSGQS